jgi:hypothetical protein
MDNDETVPVEGYKCNTQFKRQDVRAEGAALYEKKMAKATSMATPHLLMKLDTQNMAKTFKLAASDSCVDICASKCLINGQNVLVVTVYLSPNTPSDDWKSLMFSNFDGYSSKVWNIFWQGGFVRICQSYWRVTLMSTWKIITMPNLSIS